MYCPIRIYKGSYIQNLVEDGKDLNDQEAIAESLNQYFTTIASSLLDSCVRLTLTIKRRKSPALMITCLMCHIYESRTCIKLYTQPMRLKLLVLLGFPHSIKDRISQVVTHLFNESAFNMFSQVTYPTFWKTA